MTALPSSIKRVLIFSAHADDCEFFAGATVGKLASLGADITEIIATDNGRGSFELATSELVTQSRETEAKEAARILGKKGIHFLGYPDGYLDETPKNELRRQFMQWIRETKPDLVMSFDPSAPFETHPDHIHVSQAAVEAVGFANLPLYHPEQVEAGLEPHKTPYCLWFAKHEERCNHTEDVSDFLSVKLESLIVHKSQIRMMIEDMRQSLIATGAHMELLPLLDVDNYIPALETLIKAWAGRVGSEAGFEYGEAFRFESASDLFDGIMD